MVEFADLLRTYQKVFGDGFRLEFNNFQSFLSEKAHFGDFNGFLRLGSDVKSMNAMQKPLEFLIRNLSRDSLYSQAFPDRKGSFRTCPHGIGCSHLAQKFRLACKQEETQAS